MTTNINLPALLEEFERKYGGFFYRCDPADMDPVIKALSASIALNKKLAEILTVIEDEDDCNVQDIKAYARTGLKLAAKHGV